MKRKVIKQGNGTLTVTLPKDWTEKVGLSGGDEVNVEERDKNIVISRDAAKELRRIDLEVSGLDYGAIGRKMRAAYKLGYDEIALKFHNPITHEFRTDSEKPIIAKINEEVNNLLGCEIIQQTRDSCMIKDYSFASAEELESMLKKVFLMMIDYGNELIVEAKSMNRPLLETMREKHFNISKFIFYSLRILNKRGYKEYEKTAVLYHIISSLDDILDIEKYCAMNLIQLKKKSLNPKTIKVLGMIVDEFRRFFEFYYKPSDEKIKSFGDNRWKITNEIKSLATTNIPGDELIIMTDMKYILELLLPLYESAMSIHL